MKAALLALTISLALVYATYPQRQVQRPTAERWAARNFDLSLNTLPPHFAGHDMGFIYEALAQRHYDMRVKGEFESTEAFKQRVAATARRPLAGGLAADGLFAFASDIPESHYDADAQVYRLRRRFVTSKEPETQKTISQVVWQNQVVNEGGYPAQNVFGARVQIQRASSVSHQLLIDNADRLPLVKELSDSGVLLPYVGATLKISPTAAERLKPTLRMLLICRLSEFAPNESISTNEPTIHNPIDIRHSRRTLRVEAVALWFYDFSTGNILAKINVA